MAAARAQAAEGMNDDGEAVPTAFRNAVATLDEITPRTEIRLDPLPAPKRLAPYAFALEASLGVDDEELADGRFVLLHDPQGQDAWHGTFRVVTMARAELEPEMAADPLLPEVTWSWLTGALQARRVPYGASSGTVTRASSHYFGGLADREAQAEIEIRASWSPAGHGSSITGQLDAGAHLMAWCELLAQCAGLPPESSPEAGVVQLPQRRGPQPG
ncbi:DUF3000 domain-containing protein [Streptomyces sp. XM4193]|uniref:DUF3000 domain-containing protein n=1 Tax=Streptomyces sp. XM4193 TaxID=2929782 RepID=UPI001FF8F865|nr:DUF3000 domain-containing protein [Streptomyces sp. XM4193]MCK1797093.1 DUF3000 domain-containing protein [Streptomyces sp. XM4193]